MPVIVCYRKICRVLRVRKPAPGREQPDPRWRLIDLWNDLYLVGLWCLGADFATVRPAPQPEVWEAAAVVGGVCAVCWLYLRKRVQAVEVIA